MKTPPFLIAAVLLFWGWQADFLLWAGLMAAILESSRWIKFRLNFSETDLNRIWDLCGLLFAGAYVVIKSSPDIRLPAFVFPQWFPFVFFPMMLAQSFGTAETIGMKTFSWLLRWRKAKSTWANKRINFSYLYLAICIFGASTTNKFGAILTERSFNWFYAGLAVVLAWGLYSVRPRRVPLSLWCCILGLVIGGAFVTQRGLHQAQAKIETTLGSWLIRMLGRRHQDPSEGRTSIGRIGRLKLSGHIVLRVDPADAQSVPDLLRENTYVTYKNETWYTSHSDFSPLASANESWALLSTKAKHGVTIHGYLNNNNGMLALPLGTSDITNLPAALKINDLGTVRIEDGPGFASYFANFGPGLTADSPPQESDTKEIAPKERETLMKIAHDLQLDSDSPKKSDREKLQIIARFFENNFSYTTFISEEHVDRSGAKTPLAIFLEQTRSGHCEYFATATVLLARAANIPARYVTGYSVQESAKTGNTFIVRERHAHAWALVWRDGSWQNFDTTPASWDKVEEKNASFFEPFSDAWSRLSFEFSKWRYGKTSYEKYLIWALVPLVLILVWRIVFNKERKQLQTKDSTFGKTDWPGLDSEFYLIENRLAELGLARKPEETLLAWAKRLTATAPEVTNQLEGILALHRRYRFDPNGISKAEREHLQQQVQQWLAATSLSPAKTT